MNAKSNMKKRKFIKYVTVLAAAIIIRLLFAFFASFEVQKYAGVVIIVAAIAVFFTWEYVDGKRRKS